VINQSSKNAEFNNNLSDELEDILKDNTITNARRLKYIKESVENLGQKPVKYASYIDKMLKDGNTATANSCLDMLIGLKEKKELKDDEYLSELKTAIGGMEKVLEKKKIKKFMTE